MLTDRRHSYSSHRGFTLVEAMVALAVVAVAVVMLAALVGNEPTALRRLEAHRQAWELMGTVIEGLRAGQIDAASGAVDPAPWLSDDPVADTLALELVSTGVAGLEGLSRVALTVRYHITGRGYEKTIETLLWQPGQERPVP
jgi:prepilin-type N-terminal cleavage/methylation domain-containing protein